MGFLGSTMLKVYALKFPKGIWWFSAATYQGQPQARFLQLLDNFLALVTVVNYHLFDLKWLNCWRRTKLLFFLRHFKLKLLFIESRKTKVIIKTDNQIKCLPHHSTENRFVPNSCHVWNFRIRRSLFVMHNPPRETLKDCKLTRKPDGRSGRNITFFFSCYCELNYSIV